MSDVCKKCGENLYGNKVKCPFCGEPIKSGNYSNRSTVNNSSNVYRANANQVPPAANKQKNYNTSPRPVDTGGGGWGLLGFCVPIAGIVLYFVWKDERPYTAKACLNGALISIGLGIFLNIVTACMAMV